MLQPKRRRLGDHNLCFYGHKFDSEPDLKRTLETFLASHKMAICPPVRAGEWLWQGLTTAIKRCAFCAFETVTGNQNAHIELGYALAHRLRIMLFVRENFRGEDEITRWLPSDLAGLVQIRFRTYEDLPRKFEEQVPKFWYSVNERLGELLRRATDLDRSFLRALLSRPPDRPIEFHELVIAPDQEGIRGSSNNAVAEFLWRYDELLEIDRSVPPELQGDYYDAWLPPSPDVVARQGIRVSQDYREWLRNVLGLPKDV